MEKREEYMLTFEQKQEIIESFPELTRKEVSMKRVNYHYEDSMQDKTVVVQHLHPNGNGFVYVADLPNYEVDGRGLVNIREATKEELINTIADSIHLLKQDFEAAEPVEEKWVNAEGTELIVVKEDEFWNVYHGLNLEESFADYAHVRAYLKEDEFTEVQQ